MRQRAQAGGRVQAGREVPEDFASFVATQERRLRAASQDMTGNDRLAELLQRDLLAAVAMRWWWIRLRPARRRSSASAAYLDRIVRREARASRLERPARRNPVGAVRSEVAEADTSNRLADDAWERARHMRRQRWIVAAGVAAVLACVAVVGPRSPGPPTRPDLLPPPTVVPTGVVIVPPFAGLGDLPRRPARLPETVDVDPTPASPLLGQPLPAAIAVMRQGLGPLVVVGEGGATRRVDDPRLAAARLLTTSLSPDGARIAMTRASDLLVVDVTTGEVRLVTAGAAQPNVPSLAWHTPRSVLVPSLAGAREVNVDTGALSDLAGVGGADVVTNQDGNARLAELVFGAPAIGQPARIRLWRTEPAAVPVVAQSSPRAAPPATASPPASPGQSASPNPSASPPVRDVEDRTIFGPSWIGGWIDAAWSTADTFIRACGAGNLPLPPASGVARSAIAAVGANGLYLATLVSVETTTLDALGFVDAETLLVAAGLPRTETMILAWNPRSSDLKRVTAVNAYSQIALANLFAPA